MRKEVLESYERALDSGISLAEILGSAAVGLASPVAGGIAATTILARHVARLYFDRASDRVADLHATVIDRAPEEHRERIMAGRIQAEDYYSVVNSAISDDEGAKLGYYATFLRNHLLGAVPPDSRIRLLRGLRELTHEEVQLLRRINIAAKHDMMSPGGIVQQVEQMLVARDERRAAALESLQRFGFLRTEDGVFKLTKLAQLAGTLYFVTEDLEPQSIGQPTWSGIRILLATPQLAEHTQLLLKMERILFSKAIKANIVSTAPDVLRRLPFTTRLIVLLLDHRGLPERHKAGLQSLHGKVIVKVLLAAPDGSAPDDPIPELEAVRTLEMLRDEKLMEFAALADEIVSAVGRRREEQ